MIRVNPNFSKLKGSYLFSEVAKRESAFISAHPGAQVVKLGIGDVTRPLAPAVVDAMQKAAAELGRAESFRGYGPYEGYAFLREAIAAGDYAARGMDIAADEIFVSDGAKSDTGSFQELFSANCAVAVTDPVYPVYVDANVMAGRTGGYDDSAMGYEGIVYLPTTAENGFVPEIPDGKVDLVYLCSPNNPTGAVLRKPALRQWVDWANKTGAVILMDSAYESFITEDDVPRSIFEIEGARTCAVEFRSFSKSAGFTGTRCAYTVVPKELTGMDASGAKVSLNDMWMRRQSTKFNGVSYVIQRGAEAVYSKDGKVQNAEIIDGYLKNAKRIRAGLEDIGLEAYGGVNSPYVWLKTPNNMKSWDFFDKLLAEANVVGTPGSGFGSKGEHYFRLTAFNTEENTKKAVERIKQLKF
jgi:LL-diaminopimelate aminotransferase